MAVDVLALRQSAFWKKKFRRLAEVRDADKDGYISQADFMLVVERCKKLSISTPRYIEKFTQYRQTFCESFDLVDESVKFTYSEFENKWCVGAKKLVEQGTATNMLVSMFHILDTDEDGFISFEERTAHHQVVGIDTAHARASFDAIDSNHDQKISEDEFVKYHMEFFLSTENKLKSAILFGPLE